MHDALPQKIRKVCLSREQSARDALLILETSHKEIVLVVDDQGRLVGTVTDGDIRRAILADKSVDTALAEVMNPQPVVGNISETHREWGDLMKRHRILQLPIVDGDGCVRDLVLLSEMIQVDIPLADTHFAEKEITAVGEVLRSGWLSMGDLTQRFESQFAEFIGVEHACAVANGTAALHLACAALGLGEGDEVLCPSLSFVATSNAVLYAGATPVFCEVGGPEDLGMDPRDIVARITEKTKAIIVMHYGGYACDMAAIADIANRYGLYLIEDAAHAPGARSSGRQCGAWGDIACFSFFANKNMTTGEGGMVTTHSAELAKRLKLMRSHGMTTLTLDRHRGRAYTYDVVELGYNYRLDEMRAALGLVQLGQLAEWNDRRRDLVRLYRSKLALLPEVSVPYLHIAEEDSSCHIMPILLDETCERTRVMQQMREWGIQTSIHYPAIHLFSYYREHFRADLPVTEAVAARQLTLPLFPTMTEDQVEKVVEALSEITVNEGHIEKMAVGY